MIEITMLCTFFKIYWFTAIYGLILRKYDRKPFQQLFNKAPTIAPKRSFV